MFKEEFAFLKSRYLNWKLPKSKEQLKQSLLAAGIHVQQSRVQGRPLKPARLLLYRLFLLGMGRWGPGVIWMLLFTRLLLDLPHCSGEHAQEVKNQSTERSWKVSPSLPAFLPVALNSTQMSQPSGQPTSAWMQLMAKTPRQPLHFWRS